MSSRLAAFLLAAALCAAQKYDDSIFSALEWRSIGPNRGGRSITSAGSAARPNEYYFGATGGGLWKTTDGGATWKPVTDGQLKSSSVGAVAVSESNPDVVYIGMGETELRGNIMQGDGVYKSTDAGKTWKHVGLADTQAIARIRIDPSNPDIVYVAALGHPYGANSERGVFRTRDGGRTWQKILYKDDHAGAVDLTLDPHDSKVMYAAIWDAYRTSWTLSSGGPRSGFYKSTDGGDHWTEITRNSGLPQGIIGKIGVAVSADSNRVYAMVEADDGGLFRSEDAGAHWTRINEDRRIRQRAFYYTRITADPKNKDVVYIMNTGLFKSADGGKTVKQLRPRHGDHHDLWIASNDPLRMINSNDGGANISVNGGETWSNEDYPTAQLYHVATTIDVPYHVCGAQQDNSTICVTSAPAGRGGGGGGGDLGRPTYSPGGGESGYIAPDPKNADLLYAGSQGALLSEYDRRTGHQRDVQVYPLFFSGMPSSALKERWQWTFPIVFNPIDPKILYTSSQHLWKTTNRGQTWERISPDLTRADPKTLGDSGGPITKDQNGPEIYATIFSIAPSHFDVNTIWTGSDDGYVFITRDGGRNWKNITPQGLPDFIRVSLIEASPTKAGTAYLAAKNYQADDRKPYAYRTDDFGATWTKITNGIAEDDYVHAIREDPKRPGLLFAGTEHGIYVSFNNGGEWQSLRRNLPDTQVPDMVIDGDDLVIATHGRSFYILDDITLLRQLTAPVQTTHLFTPKPAVRSLDRGATLDYFLPKEADAVRIEILDSAGKVIRTFTGSADEEKKLQARRQAEGGDDEGGGGRGAVRPPTRKAGGNRYSWDLRYPGATTFEGMIFWGAPTDQGPLAVPGRYQVRLTANGVTETRPLTVERDPRELNITQADLEEQFKLATQVRDKTSEANDMVIRIRDLKKQIDDRVKKAPALNASGERLSTHLSGVEEDVYQVRNRSNQDPLNFPIKINNQLGALFRIIETGDAKPTDQSYVVFKELSTELDAIKQRLDTILQSDLATFNSAARAAGQPEIK